MERSADILDQADEATQRFREAKEAEIRQKLKPEQVQNDDGTWPHEFCVECGDDLPLGRIELGRIRCVVCQEKIERKHRGLFSI